IYVANMDNKTVTWSVNGVNGGDSTVGKITPAGVYTAPLLVPANNVVKVRATSAANASLFSESTLTLQNPVPVISALTPNAVNIGTFTVKITGTGFLSTSTVMLGDAAVNATFVSGTEINLTLTDTTARTTSISVVNPDPGGAKSNIRTFTVMP